MIQISLVEDDDQTRDAWAIVLNGTPGFRCVSTHASAECALRNLPIEKADAVLVDLGLAGMSGIDLIRRLKQQRPKLLLCVLTVHEDTERIFESLQAGASGYILKRTAPAQILELLAEMMAGGSPMSPAIARKVTQFFHRLPTATKSLDRLTDRELDILHHVSQGKSDKQIAEKLGISVNTVRNHTSAIYDKLHVHSRTEATARYLGRAHGRR